MVQALFQVLTDTAYTLTPRPYLHPRPKSEGRYHIQRPYLPEPLSSRKERSTAPFGYDHRVQCLPFTPSLSMPLPPLLPPHRSPPSSPPFPFALILSLAFSLSRAHFAHSAPLSLPSFDLFLDPLPSCFPLPFPRLPALDLRSHTHTTRACERRSLLWVQPLVSLLWMLARRVHRHQAAGARADTGPECRHKTPRRRVQTPERWCL